MSPKLWTGRISIFLSLALITSLVKSESIIFNYKPVPLDLLDRVVKVLNQTRFTQDTYSSVELYENNCIIVQPERQIQIYRLTFKLRSLKTEKLKACRIDVLHEDEMVQVQEASITCQEPWNVIEIPVSEGNGEVQAMGCEALKLFEREVNSTMRAMIVEIRAPRTTFILDTFHRFRMYVGSSDCVAGKDERPREQCGFHFEYDVNECEVTGWVRDHGKREVALKCRVYDDDHREEWFNKRKNAIVNNCKE